MTHLTGALMHHQPPPITAGNLSKSTIEIKVAKKHHNSNNYLISILREGVKLHTERVCVSASYSFAYFVASKLATYMYITCILHDRPAASN